MDINLMSIRYEVGLLNRYLKSLSAHINTLPNDVETHYTKLWEESQNDNKNISDDDAQEFIDSKNDELISVCFDIPKYFYSSFLISCYSFIEHNLFKICDMYGVKINVGIYEFDSKDKGIFKVKSFLKKANKHEFPNREWSELINFNRLRNFLVHNGNEIGINYDYHQSDKLPISKICGMDVHLNIDKKLYNYLKSNKLIQSFGYRELIIPTEKYCLKILELTEKLLIPFILQIKNNNLAGENNKKSPNNSNCGRRPESAAFGPV